MQMPNWIRRKLLPGCATVLASAILAACGDSPVAPRHADPSRTLIVTMDTAAAVAVADTSNLWTPDCNLDNFCTPTGSVTVPEPGGNFTIGTFNSTWSATLTVGGNTYKYQMGLTGVGGSFIGILWKNGTFAGYWGYCLFENAKNRQYKTTDPATGKVSIHWENHELDTAGNLTGEMYHYIYDPQTNTLKVYHRQRNGTTSLIYQGAPIKNHGKLPPPDPAPGAGPYTNENQYLFGRPVPPVPAAPSTPGTLTPSTPGGLTPSGTTETVGSSPEGAATMGASTRWRSTVIARPVTDGRLTRP
jgi:hypothetical protein